MTLLGSAHNLREINEKKKQGIDLIFLAPIFKVKKIHIWALLNLIIYLN